MCTTCMLEYQAALSVDGSYDAAPAANTVSDYTALLRYVDSSNARWNGPTTVGTAVVVTYSFTETADLPSLSSYNPYNASSYWAFDETQRQHYREALSKFEAVAGIKFVEIEEPAMVNVFGANVSGVGGWANYAYSTDYMTGEGNFVNAYSSMSPGAYGFQINLHEMGHALGLKHPHEGGSLTLAAAEDTQANTVMTYNVQHPYAQDLGVLDVQALQHLYGSANNMDGWNVSSGNGKNVRIVANGDDNKILSTDQLTVIKAGRGNDEVIGRENVDIVFAGKGEDTVTGGYGNDRLYGSFDNDVLIGGLDQSDLSGGSLDNDRLYGEHGNDSLYGGHGNDQMYGGSGSDYLQGGAGIDRLSGGDGDDILIGGAGIDRLIGGTGADMFRFSSSDGTDPDRIMDFEVGIDKIDLSGHSYMTWNNIDLRDVADGGALVTYGSSFQLKLFDVMVDELSQSDFIFA